MRLALHFKISNNTIPLDYRNGFLSLLKKSFELVSKDLYLSLYGCNTLKPFTFSVYFGNRSEVDKENVYINSDSIILNFSTLSLELGTYFYNGLLKVKRELKQYPLFNAMLSLDRVALIRESKIKDNVAVFKTLSPFLVRDFENNNRYFKPADDNFNSQLQFAVSACTKTFLGREANVEFNNIKISSFPVLHYAMPVTANKGMFALKGEPEILDMIYQIGLGSRRSQGFGMLEVMK